MQAAHVRYPFWRQVRARWTRMSRRSSIVLSLEYSTGGRVASMFAGICQRLARRRTGTFSMPTAGTFSVSIDTPRLSLARSSTVGMSSSSVGSPQPGVLLPFRGWDWCVTGDPAASDSAEPPQNAQNRRESGLPSVGGAWAWTARHRVGQGPTHGRILKPVPVTAKLPAGDPPRITSAGSSATTGLRVGAPRRPTLPWRAGNAGVRGGAAPRQPPQGTHGVWPHGVTWLVSHNHADSRLICMTGSRGRPELLSARRGERSEPERALNRDGGRIDMLAGRKGPLGVWSPPSFPPVLNGYTSIEARMTSTGEGKNT